MAARTHGQQAVPITFAFKVAGWEDELARTEAAATASLSHRTALADVEGRSLDLPCRLPVTRMATEALTFII